MLDPAVSSLPRCAIRFTCCGFARRGRKLVFAVRRSPPSGGLQPSSSRLSLACPFDLHALLPVPGAILQLGPTHPAALAWLTAHWGITDRLRQVVVRDKVTTGRRLPRNQTVIGYSFFTHQDTPNMAIRQLAAR